MSLLVTKMGINGEGIAYKKGRPIFIEGALKDEEVEAKIYDEQKNYARARLLKVVKASPYRIVAKCPYFESCGACQIMHLEKAAQKEYKVEQIRESLFKYAGLDDVAIDELITDEKGFAYRNSLKLPLTVKKGKLVTGLYEHGSNHILAIDKCLIHDPEIERVRKNVLNVLNKYHLALYDHKSKKGMRALYIRHLMGQIELCLVTGRDELAKSVIDDLARISKLSSIYQSVNTSSGNSFFGKSFKHLALATKLNVRFMGLKVDLSLPSFFQLNTHMAELLYSKVIELLDEGETLFEGYAGIGLMSLLASDKFQKVYAVESIAQAIQNAKAMAKKNHISNVEFFYDDASKALKRVAKKEKITTLLVDPPRSGLDDDMLLGIIKALPKKIVYVSCNPSTLAKNIAYLKKYYRLEKVIPFDLFPNSAHVESIVLLQKEKTNQFYRDASY